MFITLVTLYNSDFILETLPIFGDFLLLSLLRAEVQPTSGPQHGDRVTDQCASPG